MYFSQAISSVSFVRKFMTTLGLAALLLGSGCRERDVADIPEHEIFGIYKGTRFGAIETIELKADHTFHQTIRKDDRLIMEHRGRYQWGQPGHLILDSVIHTESILKGQPFSHEGQKYISPYDFLWQSFPKGKRSVLFYDTEDAVDVLRMEWGT